MSIDARADANVEIASGSGASADLNGVVRPVLPPTLDFGAFEELDVALDPHQGALWCLMRPKGLPRFTDALLRDLARASRMIADLHAAREPGAPNPVRYWVVGSAVPGVYNLGGDLAFFVQCVRERDREGLRAYAHACVEATYRGAYGMDAPCVSIAVVEGDALGGGFEAAMSGHVLIAERGARLGLPETMFNTFPGMGAYSFLARKLDMARAEKIILGGKIFQAEELHEMGVVDILAEKGQGREAARQFMADNDRRQPLLCALSRVRKRVFPLEKQELLDVTDIWVDATMALTPNDLRKMEILLKAQRNRLKASST